MQNDACQEMQLFDICRAMESMSFTEEQIVNSVAFAAFRLCACASSKDGALKKLDKFYEHVKNTIKDPAKRRAWHHATLDEIPVFWNLKEIPNAE